MHPGFFAGAGFDRKMGIGILAANLLKIGGKHELFVTAFDTCRAEREREAKLILSQGTACEAIANLYQKIVRDASAGDSSRGCEYQSGCGNGAPRP